MADLFSSLQLRDVRLRNRIGVSPMCQYSSVNGFAHDWHFVHLGSFAIGGAALVMTEAAAVTPEGRISPQDLGIWDDAHVPMLTRITEFIAAQGAAPGIQLAHAGRKASTKRPWEGIGELPVAEGGWVNVLAPSSIPFGPNFPTPNELTRDGIQSVIHAFRAAARRALAAGFRVIELHAAHGYLIHEFLSPLSNLRTDDYGGSFDNRTRFCLNVVSAIRAVWPESYPLLVRISATDWVEGGWDVDEAVALAKLLRQHGVDLVDCSSGGLSPAAKVVFAKGYHVPFSERIRREAGIATAAVGLITGAEQANQIVSDEKADLVFLARELLRQPHWPLLAAHQLGVTGPWPSQYLRARPPAIDSLGQLAEGKRGLP